MIIIIMGVAGSGKTTIGKLLAESLGWEFSDADDFHSPSNIQKMQKGIPLTEADRIPWLEDLQTAIKQWLQANKNMILACSALKNSYRDYLVVESDRVRLIYLRGSYELIKQRLQNRQNHYLGVELLESQFAALEEPSDTVYSTIYIDISSTPTEIVDKIRHDLNLTVS